MRSIESEGATIDAAIAQALAALGAPRELVHVEILEAECAGVLGFGRRKARVCATMREPKAWLEGTAPARAPRVERVAVSGTAARPSGAPAAAAASLPPAAELVRETLRLMGIAATVTEGGRLAVPGESPEGQAHGLTVASKEADAVLGRRGETLEALEYLVNRMLDQAGRSDRHVTLDAAGYRAKRQTAIEHMVRRACDRARERKRAVTLEMPLGPSDRKLVHELLESERGFTVKSLGQGLYRKLTLIPEGRRKGGGKTAG
jgi:spoIIIJ-associated protein